MPISMQGKEKLLTSANNAGQNENSLAERPFYMDCDPREAVERTLHVEKIAEIINNSHSFGSLAAQDKVRDAFAAELEISRNLPEAACRMNNLLGLINLRLSDGLKLGPHGLGVCERLYLINPDAPLLCLDLELRFNNCGSRLESPPPRIAGLAAFIQETSGKHTPLSHIASDLALPKSNNN